MALADYQPARYEVFFPGGSFFVRGLGVSDIGTLCRLHLADMEATIAIVQANPGLMYDPVVAQQFGFDLIQKIPGLAATIIAAAADEIEFAENARKLPLTAQFAALSAVAEMTFQDMAGLNFIWTKGKHLIGLALRQSDPTLIESGARPSSDGTGHGEAPPAS